jgi:hypothetical protein
VSEHSSRALRPLGIFVPLKAGTKFTVIEDEDADEGAGLIRVEISRLFDFSVALTIEDYGVLGKLIDALGEAQKAELERIKRKSRAARNERSRSTKAVPSTGERNRRRRKRNVK